MFYEGEAAWFRQVDLNALGDPYHLIPIESDLEMLGFELVGDFICSAITTIVNRAWVNRTENIGVLMLVAAIDSKLRMHGIFFDSVFSDGASATTTATPALKDREKNNSYRKVCPWTNVYNLFQEHKQYIDRLPAKHGSTIPIGENLLSIVKMMDAATVEAHKLP